MLLRLERPAFMMWISGQLPPWSGYSNLRFVPRYHENVRPLPPTLDLVMPRRFAHHDIAWAIERRYKAEQQLQRQGWDTPFSVNDRDLHTLLGHLYFTTGPLHQTFTVMDRVVVNAWVDVMKDEALFAVQDRAGRPTRMMAQATFRDVLDVHDRLDVVVDLSFFEFDEELAEQMRPYWRFGWGWRGAA